MCDYNFLTEPKLLEINRKGILIIDLSQIKYNN